MHNYLRTPHLKILIAEVIWEESAPITLLVKKRKHDDYEEVTLDFLMMVVRTKTPSEGSIFLYTPKLHIVLGELYRNDNKTPILRVKKPGTELFEEVAFPDLLGELLNCA